jgi:uncharacterized protein YxeA
VIPATPTALTVTGSTTTSVSLSWTDSAGSVTGYKLYQGGTSPVTVPSGTATTATVSSLNPGSSYTYTISAYNVSGESARSSGVSATTLPSTPGGLAASSVTASGATLTWGSVTGATSYTLYRSGTQVYHGTALTSTDTGAATGTSYSYTVLASDASGNSALSSGVSVLTLPAAPTGLVVNSTASTSLNLSWTATTGTATGYKIYTNGTSPVTVTPGTATTDTVSSLSPGTAYTYTISAYNASGESAQSSGVAATTLPATHRPDWSPAPPPPQVPL